MTIFKLHAVQLALVLCFLACRVTADAEAQLFVSPNGNDSWSGKLAEPNASNTDGPLASLDAARLKVRALGSRNPITVLIRGGEYFLTQTTVFSHEDSGSREAPVTYKAYPGEKPVFTGGIKLGNWKPVRSNPRGTHKAAIGKLWYADVPATLKGKWQITSLYDDITLLRRSRSGEFSVSESHKQDRVNAQPKDTRKSITFGDPPVTFERTITYENEDLKDWDNIQDIEIFMSPKHKWLINLLPLDSINPSSKTATFTVEPTYGFPAKNKYQVDNAIDYLDEPGEWCFNSREGRVYMWPEASLDKADIRAPYLQEFIRVEGVEDGEPARYLAFEGLTFRHGLRDTWLPGDKALQHDWEMYDKGNAVIRLRHAEYCTVKGCVFEASSGTGVRLDLYCQHNTVADNIFSHLGSTGIVLSGYAPGLKDVSKFNTITNNYLHHIGTIYRHATGIFIAQSGHNTISHNTIHDLAYNGMVISGCRPHELALHETLKHRREWVNSLRVDEIKPYVEDIKKVLAEKWLNSDVSIFEALLHARENRIEYNEIYRVMLELHDGNGIYFSGMGKHNIAQYNYIHDVTNNRGFIRLDDNSGYAYIRNNVFERGRMMLVMKWDGEYRNNFAINTRQITNKEWYPAKLDRIVFYSESIPSKLMNKEVWKEQGGRRLSEQFQRCSNSIFYAKPRAKEFKAGTDIIAEGNRDGADVGMVFVDPMFDKEAMKQRIYRFLPGSPATKLGIKPIDLSSVGSTLAK